MIRRFAQGTFLTLDIVVNRQDPVANTTTIDYSLHIERRNNWNDNFRGHANIYMDINGVNLNQNNVWWDISGHEQTKSSFLKSGSLTIQHEDSGSKSIGFSVTLQPNTQGFSWGDAQNIRIDGNMQLPFINVQKTSDFTMQDSVTLGSPFNVNINRFPNATYAMFLHVGDGRYEIRHNGGNSYTLPIDAHTKINGLSSSGTIALQTWYGGRHTGTSWKNITVNMPTSPPVISGSITPNDNSNVKNILGVNNHYVLGKSILNLSLSINKTFKYDAVFQRFQVDFMRSDGRTAWIGHFHQDTNNILINTTSILDLMNSNSITGRFRLLVVDNRDGFSNIIQSNVVTFHRYENPTVYGFVNRRNNEQDVLDLDFTWNIFSIKVNGVEKNSATINLHTKQSSAIQYTKNKTIQGVGVTKREITSLSGKFPIAYSYNVRVEIIDGFGNTTLDLGSVSTAKFPLDISRNGIGVNKIHERGAMDVDGEVYIKNTSNGKALFLEGSDSVLAEFWHGGSKKAWIGFGGTHINKEFWIANDASFPNVGIFKVKADGSYFNDNKLISRNDLPDYIQSMLLDSKFVLYRWGSQYNLNDFKTTGVYFVGSGANCPARGILHVYRISDKEIVHVLFDVDSPKVYRRVSNWQNGVWGAWMS